MEFEYRYRTNKSIYTRWLPAVDRLHEPLHARLQRIGDELLEGYPPEATLEIHIGWNDEGGKHHYDLQYRKKEAS